MATYTIEGVQQVKQMGANNHLVTTYEVAIRTGNEATGTLTVAEKDYTKEKLDELLPAFAEKLDLPFTIAAG